MSAIFLDFGGVIFSSPLANLDLALRDRIIAKLLGSKDFKNVERGALLSLNDLKKRTDLRLFYENIENIGLHGPTVLAVLFARNVLNFSIIGVTNDIDERFFASGMNQIIDDAEKLNVFDDIHRSSKIGLRKDSMTSADVCENLTLWNNILQSSQKYSKCFFFDDIGRNLKIPSLIGIKTYHFKHSSTENHLYNLLHIKCMPLIEHQTNFDKIVCDELKADFTNLSLSPILTIFKFSTGESNPTYLAILESCRYHHLSLNFSQWLSNNSLVIRQKPRGKLKVQGAHDMRREFYKILKIREFYSKQRCLVPEAICFVNHKDYSGDIENTHCEKISIRSPVDYYVMSFVSGHVYNDPNLSNISSEERRNKIYFELVRGLANIHRIRLKNSTKYSIITQSFKNLKIWGKEDDLAYRRISDILSRLDNKEFIDFNYFYSVPILHGDYRLNNCIFSETDELISILDWELSPTNGGSGLTDLASLVSHHYGLRFIETSTEKSLPSIHSLLKLYHEEYTNGGIGKNRGIEKNGDIQNNVDIEKNGNIENNADIDSYLSSILFQKSWSLAKINHLYRIRGVCQGVIYRQKKGLGSNRRSTVDEGVLDTINRLLFEEISGLGLLLNSKM